MSTRNNYMNAATGPLDSKLYEYGFCSKNWEILTYLIEKFQNFFACFFLKIRKILIKINSLSPRVPFLQQKPQIVYSPTKPGMANFWVQVAFPLEEYVF